MCHSLPASLCATPLCVSLSLCLSVCQLLKLLRYHHLDHYCIHIMSSRLLLLCLAFAMLFMAVLAYGSGVPTDFVVGGCLVLMSPLHRPDVIRC
jgi:hypothetical protein